MLARCVEGMRASDVGALNPNDWRVCENASGRLLSLRVVRAGHPLRGPPSAGSVIASGRPRGMRRVRSSAGAGSALATAASFPGPERLVGFGFRLWLNGFRTGDISNWEEAWCAYAGTIGAAAAKTAVGELSSWVRAINCYAQRRPETSVNASDRFCRDERVAIAMIAACQHHACPAMRACAFALLGCSMIDEVVEGAESFARTLRQAHQVLLPASADAPSLLTMPAATASRH